MADETILIDVEYNTDEAVKEVDDLTRSIEGLKTEQGKLDQQLKEGKISQTEYAKQSAKLKTQLQQETQSRKNAIKVINATTGSYEKLQAQTNKLIERSKKLDLSTKKGAKEFENLTKKINKNTDALKKMDSAQGRSNRNVGNYKSALQGVGSALGLVTGGAALAGVAIKETINIVKEGIEVNREFEKTFTNVLTLLDEAQKKEFGLQLESGAIDLIANYGLKIGDVNKALFDTISAGVPAGEAIDFMNKAAKLAIAGNAELSSVVDGATNVINAYGDAAGSTEEILNAFFAAQVKGKTNVALLSTNIGKVASTAAAAEIPLNELFGTFAGLTKFIGSTEESATSLAAVMNTIINPSEQAAKAFEELGIETGITGIKNNGLLETLVQVSKAYEENNDVLSELVPNIRAFKGIAGLNADAIKEIEQNVLDLNDAQASSNLVQQAFNEQMATRTKQAELLTGNWQRLLITIGRGENIFKKVGLSMKANLSNQFAETSKMIDFLRVRWQQFTREITKDEATKRYIEIEKRFRGITDSVEKTTVATQDFTETIEENTEVTKTNEKAVESSVMSIDSLKDSVKKLEEQKKALSITDEAGIATKNREIEAIKFQIKELENLGKAQKDYSILRIANADFEKGIQEDLKTFDFELKNELEEGEKLYQKRILDIKEEFNKIDVEKTKEREEKKRGIVNTTFDALKSVSQEVGQFLIDTNQARQDSQLSALETRLQTELLLAEGNERKQEEIRNNFDVKKLKLEKDFARKQRRISITNAIINGALAITKALAQLGPIAGGIAAAAIATTTGFQIARIRKQKFKLGGQVPIAKRGASFGTFEGPSHSNGGIPLINGLTGETFAEVENKEKFFVVNKDASNFINSLSDINQRIGGGVPLTTKATKMQDGGQADIQQEGGDIDTNNLARQIAANLPPIFVKTVDIKTGLTDREDVINVGVF